MVLGMKHLLFAILLAALLSPTISWAGVGYALPEQSVVKLPLEWRGFWLSLDGQNYFKNRFGQIEYGLSASAMLGLKQYNFRFETIAPLSSQGWQYRARIEYRLF